MPLLCRPVAVSLLGLDGHVHMLYVSGCVAKLVPVRMKPRRRLGLLKQLLSTEDLAALADAVEAPLSPADQAALEGKHTDALGIARRQARSSP